MEGGSEDELLFEGGEENVASHDHDYEDDGEDAGEGEGEYGSEEEDAAVFQEPVLTMPEHQNVSSWTTVPTDFLS